MPQTVILSVGLDPQLLGSRNLVLQSAGYIAVPAYSTREAVDCFQNGDFDLVLLCQSMPAKEQDRLTGWIRASGSRIPVVLVAGKLCQNNDFAGVTAGCEPGALLWGIREVLINAGTSALRSTTRHDRLGPAATEGKKPPASSTGYEQQLRAARGRLVPFARIG